MRTRGRVIHEPRLTESERAVAVWCPRGCGGFLSEEPQRGANGAFADVLFCLKEGCGWREWTVDDLHPEIERLALTGCKPSVIAEQLGISERTVFRQIRRSAA